MLTPGILMTEAVARARELVEETPDAVMLDQLSNPANAEIHRRTTAVEIWEDTRGSVDVFVRGRYRTHITGVGEVLKERKRGLRVVPEPAGAALLSGGSPGSHQMPGIGVDSFRRS